MADDKKKPEQPQPPSEERALLEELKRQVTEGLALLNEQRAELEKHREQLLQEAERLNSDLAEKLKAKAAMSGAQRRATELNEHERSAKHKYEPKDFVVTCVGLGESLTIAAIDPPEAIRRAVLCLGIDPSKHVFRVSS